MNYNISSLFTASSCRIVFADDTEMSLKLAKDIAEYDSDYHDRLNDVLGPKKIGPFTAKNKSSVWDILKKTPKIKDEGLEYLQQQTKGIDIYYYTERVPSALSRLQKEKVSVLYDAFCGRTKFFLTDCSFDTDDDEYIFIRSYSHYFTVANWLNTYSSKNKREYDLILITGMPKMFLLDYISEEEYFSDAFSFFSVENNELVKQDKYKFISELLPIPAGVEDFRKRSDVSRMTKEQKFEEGRKYVHFTLEDTEQDKENAKIQILWYGASALEGYLPAQYMLGAFYECGCGVCEINMDSALLWYSKAAFDKNYNEYLADNATKEYRNTAKKTLKRLAISMPGAEEKILQYGGKDGEKVVRMAKIEQALDGKEFFDPEYIKKIMDKTKKDWGL